MHKYVHIDFGPVYTTSRGSFVNAELTLGVVPKEGSLGKLLKKGALIARQGDPTPPLTFVSASSLCEEEVGERIEDTWMYVFASAFVTGLYDRYHDPRSEAGSTSEATNQLAALNGGFASVEQAALIGRVLWKRLRSNWFKSLAAVPNTKLLLTKVDIPLKIVPPATSQVNVVPPPWTLELTKEALAMGHDYRFLGSLAFLGVRLFSVAGWLHLVNDSAVLRYCLPDDTLTDWDVAVSRRFFSQGMENWAEIYDSRNDITRMFRIPSRFHTMRPVRKADAEPYVQRSDFVFHEYVDLVCAAMALLFNDGCGLRRLRRGDVPEGALLVNLARGLDLHLDVDPSGGWQFLTRDNPKVFIWSTPQARLVDIAQLFDSESDNVIEYRAMRDYVPGRDV